MHTSQFFKSAKVYTTLSKKLTQAHATISAKLLIRLLRHVSTREQLLLRMHTAYFQAGTYVVDRLLPADRLIIIVSGRLPLVPTLLFKAPIVCVCSSTSTL